MSNLIGEFFEIHLNIIKLIFPAGGGQWASALAGFAKQGNILDGSMKFI